MPPGGARQGKAGTNYANRTDLSGSSSGDRMYGDGVNKATVQATTPDTVTARPPVGQAPPPPGSLGGLTAPSERPTEPVTTGLSLGAGAGPEAVGNVGYTRHDQALWELRALAARYPDNRDLLKIIALAEARQ